jgi:serine/threonine protein kinase
MIGTTLRQRYQIIQNLRSGGFGETYVAEDLDIPVSPKPKCVVKRLKPKTIDPDMQRLFKKEAEILYKLGQNHPQIPKLYAYFEENQEFYLVQELIDGNDLTEEMTPGKQWSEAEVIKFLQELLEILAFVHQNQVIHRDIKPSNIMRRRQDSKLILIDFGVVKQIRSAIANSPDLTSSTIGIGTFGYMPSEQALGKPRLSSDIYAVGITAIQALTGITPQELPEDDNGEIIWQNHAQVSNELAKILSQMVRYHFNQRYQSAVEALEALNSAIAPAASPIASPKPIQNIVPAARPAVPPKPIQNATPAARPVVSPIFAQNVAPPAPQPAPFAIASPKPVKIGSKWGYKDQTGRIVIPPQFDKAGKFSEGLAEVKIGSKYGYVDQTGRVIIQPQFDKAWSFSKGQARVKIGSDYLSINNTGEMTIQPRFDEDWSFSEGLAVVKIGDQYGCIDKQGRVVSQFFDEVMNFSEGLAVVRIANQYAYIDKTGQVVSEFFDQAMSFSEGLAAVKIGSKWGYIDQTGQLVIQPQFYQAGSFSQGQANVEVKNKVLGLVSMGEQWRTIDKTGKFADKK